MRCLVGLLLLAIGSASAQLNDGDSVPSLAAMRNRNRPLIVFFASRGPESQVEQQLKELRGHRTELSERDVIVLLKEDDTKSLRRDPSLDVTRRRFHVEIGSFAVVLVGKDGGEKFRSHEPVTIERLNALIDAMPMRQQEVQDGHPK